MTNAPDPESDIYDPEQAARAELGANSVPTPDDLMADVGPLAVLLYLRELSYYGMRLMSASLSIDNAEPPADDSEPVRALAALSQVCGELDGACVLVGLLPADYGADALA